MINLHLGNIAEMKITAIVNAANTSLLAGSGVSGAIHEAAGPDLEKECLDIGGCPVGFAVITNAYKLNAKYVIHTVGPKYFDGTRDEELQLRSCYKSIFQIAAEYEIDSVAIPAISTGIYRYPLMQAIKIATEETALATAERPLNVTFCCFDHEAYLAYKTHLE